MSQSCILLSFFLFFFLIFFFFFFYFFFFFLIDDFNHGERIRKFQRKRSFLDCWIFLFIFSIRKRIFHRIRIEKTTLIFSSPWKKNKRENLKFQLGAESERRKLFFHLIVFETSKEYAFLFDFLYSQEI